MQPVLITEISKEVYTTEQTLTSRRGYSGNLPRTVKPRRRNLRPYGEQGIRPAFLNLGSVDRFKGVRELGWGKNYSFVFTNLELKFSASFNNECQQQSNLWPLDSKNVC
jgi:hypothetical protein